MRFAEPHWEAGVEIVGLHWLLVSPKGLYINHPDDAIRLRTQEYMIALIALCSDLGGKVMVVGSPKQRDVLEGQTLRDTWERTLDVFGACVPVAERSGVTLCLEPLDGAQTQFITDTAQALRMVEEIAHPNFQTMVDVRSACFGERETIPEVIFRVKDHLRHFHANDANGLGPGFGKVDYGPIAASLEEAGYQGFASVEVFDFTPGPKEIASKSLTYLRKFL
ncbi:MAG: sugar phosphate isomerase/epimerase family protein [Candidatus Latescibacterota bacterium]